MFETVSRIMDVNLFLNLMQLRCVTAKGIFDSLLDRLESYGMTEDYVKTYLVCVTRNGPADVRDRVE
jgi:hypothetical protein